MNKHDTSLFADAPAKKSRVVATTMQTIRIHELLKEHVEVVGEGRCRYKAPDMTDGKIAEMVGEGINAQHVGYVRTETFGVLFVKRKYEGAEPSRIEAQQVQIASLQRSASEVEEHIAFLQKRMTKNNMRTEALEASLSEATKRIFAIEASLNAAHDKLNALLKDLGEPS